MRTTLTSFLILVAASITTVPRLFADPITHVAETHENTLNELIRELPILNLSREAELRKLSAIQEMLYLHELKMRGEGLPPELAIAFSINYSSIISALIEDRINENFGREMLHIHRQLLGRTHLWMNKRVRDENFPSEVIENLNFFLTDLQKHAIPLPAVSESIRTPVINGYQVWLGELLAWGCQRGTLNAGELSSIDVRAAELERFEGYYKKDGILQPYEREQLHGRFLNLTRDTIEIIGR